MTSPNEEVVSYSCPADMSSKGILTIRNTVATEQRPATEPECRRPCYGTVSIEHVGLRRSTREQRVNEVWGKWRLTNKLRNLRVPVADISTQDIMLSGINQ